MRFSTNSDRLLIGYWDGAIDTWNLSNQRLNDTPTDGKPVVTDSLKAHPRSIRTLHLTSDGRHLVSMDSSGTAKLWDLDRTAASRILPSPANSESGDDAAEMGFCWLAFSPGGRQLIAGRANDSGHDRWELRETRNDDWLPTLETTGNCVALSTNAQYLAADEHGGSVRIWDLSTRKLLTTWHVGLEIASLAVSPDGRFVAAGTGSPRYAFRKHSVVFVWDVEKSQQIEIPLQKFEYSITGLAFTPGSLVATSRLGNVRFWDTSVWQLKSSSETSSCLCLALSPNLQTVATGHVDGTITLWDVDTGLKQDVFADQLTAVKALTFSPDGRTLAAGLDHHIVLWDVDSGLPTRRLPIHDDLITGLAFSRDGTTLGSANLDGPIRLWEAAPLPEIDRHPLTIRSLVRRGEIQCDRNDFEDAEDTLRCALRIQNATGIDPPAATRLTLAEALVGQQRHDEAVELLTAGLNQRPGDERLLQGRAEAHDSADQFEQAAEDYLALAKLRNSTWQAFHAGTLFLKADNLEGYRRSCRFISRIGAGLIHDHAVEQAAKTCLLLPDQYEAEAVIWQANLERRQATATDAVNQWITNALVLIAYRQGDYERAEKRIAEAYELRKTGAVDKGWCILLALQAMNAHQLGHDTDARRLLAESKTIIEQVKQHAPIRGENRMTVLRDVYMAEILCREASSLLRQR